MSTPNLNHPALFTGEKLDAADFACVQGDAQDSEQMTAEVTDGLPGPTHAATVAGAVIFVVGAILVIVGGWHLIALAVS